MQRSEFLIVVSEELDDLVASATAIQATLGEVLRHDDGVGRDGIWHLQELDRLQQTLDDLSVILRVAAEDDGPSINVERLARAARLGALRERLRGSNCDEVAGIDAGIVAIF
jgi:hypothetical protein